MDSWAAGTESNADARAWRRGDVVTEWRLRVSIPGEDVHPLLPDVAYMSLACLRPLSVVERKSLSVQPIVDPDARTVDVYDTDGRYEQIDDSVAMYSPTIIPDLLLPLRAIFAELEIPDA